MQKKPRKEKPEYAKSIKAIGERRSDVPLKLHRRKSSSFGSGKIADSDVRESSTVIRPSVFFSFPPFSLPFHGICASKTGKRVRFSNFLAENTTNAPLDLRKRRKKMQKKEKKAPPDILADKHKWHP